MSVINSILFEALFATSFWNDQGAISQEKNNDGKKPYFYSISILLERELFFAMIPRSKAR